MVSAPTTVFREIVEEPFHSLVDVARDEGKRVLGYTCSFVPEPLLSVEGLFPQRLRVPSPCGTPMADTYMSSVTCQYPRNLLERALDDGFEHIDGWVFVSSCDHVRRLYDNLSYLVAPAFCAMLDLPHKTGGPAVDWYAAELRRLAKELEAHFAVDVGEGALRAAIARHNEFLAVVRAIDELRKRRPSPISGTDFHRMMVAMSSVPKESLRGQVEELRKGLASQAGGDEPRARVMVLGSGIDDPGYLQVIESVGAAVVADRFCFGSMPGLEAIADGDEPFEVLAKHALRTTQCPRTMGAFEGRVQFVRERIEAYGVDGVIVETMKFCDLWGVEGAPLVDVLRDAGVPVLRVEREYAPTGEGQLKTRVQAFLESMGR